MNDIKYHEWKTDKLDALFDLEPGYAFKSADFIESGVPVIKIKNVKAGYFSEHEFSYVDPKFVSERPTKVARYGDLLISMSGNRHDGSPETWVGKVSPFRKKTVHLINQRVGALRVKDPTIIDARFAGYVLASPPYQTFFISIATSSGGQANISPMQILGADFYYPNIDEQRAIAHILGSLDDMIELNRRMNATLEGIARALFQSWFVDFDPVRAKLDGRQPFGMDQATADLFPDAFQDSPLGPIPKGWSYGCVGECFRITMGQSPPGSTYNQVGDGIPFYQGKVDFGTRFPTRRVYCTAPTRFAQKYDTLVSVRAPVGAINMASEECCIGRGLAAVRYKSHEKCFTYFAMKSLDSEFSRYEAEGTVFGSINKQNFHSLPFVLPDDQVVAAFEKTFGPFDDQIKINEFQSRTLAELRDTLLPKLLSGELSVDEAGRCVEQAV